MCGLEDMILRIFLEPADWMSRMLLRLVFDVIVEWLTYILI